jgi:hypothetical protein
MKANKGYLPTVVLFLCLLLFINNMFANTTLKPPGPSLPRAEQYRAIGFLIQRDS